MALMKHIQEYSADLFTWRCESKVASIEVSELTLGRVREPFSRVYDDAIDEGFVTYNEETGKRVTWANWQIETRDGDTLWWEFRPIPVQGQPDMTGWTMMVFND